MPVPGPNSANSQQNPRCCELSHIRMGKFPRQAAAFLWHATHFLDVGPVLARPVLATSS